MLFVLAGLMVSGALATAMLSADAPRAWMVLVLVVFGASMLGLVGEFTQEIFATIAGGPQ
mgnify:CR=1 FL=1